MPRSDAAAADDVYLPVIARARGRIHLDAAAVDWESNVPAVFAAAGVSPAGRWTLAGGEPTLWASLPVAVERLAARGISPGIATDGWSLAEERVARDLASRGLQRAVIQLHAPRPDAHDWITGVPGSARRAVRAARVCRDAGLELGGEIWLTKPGAAHLVETVAVLARLGARAITVRRLGAHQVEEPAKLSLLPRLIPSLQFITAAARSARVAGVEFRAAGLPGCVLSLCRGSGPALKEESRADVDGAPPARVETCSLCAGRIPCSGVPADYLQRFGALELRILQQRAGGAA